MRINYIDEKTHDSRDFRVGDSKFGIKPRIFAPYIYSFTFFYSILIFFVVIIFILLLIFLKQGFGQLGTVFH